MATVFYGIFILYRRLVQRVRRNSTRSRLHHRLYALGVCAATVIGAAPDGGTPEISNLCTGAPTVQLDILPPRLPNAVSEQLPNVGSIDAYTEVDGKVAGMYSGSVVKISPDTYLTAGHVVQAMRSMISAKHSDMSTPYVPPRVRMPTPTPIMVADTRSGMLIPKYGTSLSADVSASLYAHHSISEPQDDVGIVKTVASAPLASTPPVSLLDAPLKVGDAVFFVNYQPTPDGMLRSPDESMFGTDSHEKPIPQSTPALYGGVVLAVLPDGDPVIATGLESYGATPDTLVRPGASGGAIFTQAGKLAAITTMYSPAPFPPNTVIDNLGVCPTTESPLVHSVGLAAGDAVSDGQINMLNQWALPATPDYGSVFSRLQGVGG